MSNLPRGTHAEEMTPGAVVRCYLSKRPDVKLYGIVVEADDLPAQFRAVSIPKVGDIWTIPVSDLAFVDEEMGD